MENNKWIRFIIDSNSNFFPVFQQVIKQVKPEKDNVIIKVLNKEKSQKLKMEYKEHFKFVFDWQENNICGIEVFKLIEGE
jgi:hypothetical protein